MIRPNPYQASPSPAANGEQESSARRVLDLGRLMFFGCLFLISFRFLALPLAIYLSFRHPHRSFRAPRAVAWCFLILTLLSPVDVAVPGLVQLRGQPQEQFRLVRAVSGLPAHTTLVARHGEYISTGCSGLPCVYQPAFYFVWW